ncbi:phosphoserine phosphatase SerB [Alteromonas sp. 14N.309.X.WAT.G.H12]|uniref:phosphoserine phosphatase SerB n=1 Tax=Alteromonas sp. 14N.309.X.WAT.G.H12 TaxID=3120824 RepID=UPI002FD367E7
MSELSVSNLHSRAELTQLFKQNAYGVRYAAGKWFAESTAQNPKDSAVLTVIAPAMTLHQLAQLTSLLAPVLSMGAFYPHPLNGTFHETALVCPVRVCQAAELKDRLEAAANALRLDIAVQTKQPALDVGGLLVMDMDSTVIEIECIDEIAKLAGLGDKVAKVTAQAMRGELAFSESLISRVACLEGVPVAQLAQIRDSIPLMPGVVPLIETLKSHGWKIAIASGGFTYFADHLKARLGLDAAFSNTLATEDEILTGKVLGSIVDARIKAQTVSDLAEKWAIPNGQTIAMGDGANDLLMMEKAALGVACHAKPVVREKADVAIRFGGLHRLLYLLR